jgi:hypothetical protein
VVPPLPGLPPPPPELLLLLALCTLVPLVGAPQPRVNTVFLKLALPPQLAPLALLQGGDWAKRLETNVRVRTGC